MPFVICVDIALREIELFDLGAASVAEAQEDLVLAHTPTTRYESSFFFAPYLSRRLRYRVNWKALVGDREPMQNIAT